MAIDPSISLAVRPVQMPVPNIQSPVDQLAQVLSLRHLMTQGQTGQLDLQTKTLQLQQLQRQMQEQQDYAKLLAGQLDTTGAAPVQAAPVQIAPPAQTAPIQPPTGLTGGPESVPGLPNIGALPSPAPGAPLGALMTSTASQPAPAPPAAALPTTAGQGGSPVMGGLNAGQFIARFPLTGLDHLKQQFAFEQAQAEAGIKQHDAAMGKADELGRIAASVRDSKDPAAQFTSGLMEASGKGLLDPAIARQMIADGYDKHKNDIDAFIVKAQNAKDYSETTKNNLAAGLDDRKQAAMDIGPVNNQDDYSKFLVAHPKLQPLLGSTFSPQLKDVIQNFELPPADRYQQSMLKTAQNAQLLSDPSQIPQFISEQPAAAQPYLKKLAPLGLDQFKQYVGMAATQPKPGETMPLPAAVQTQKVEQQAAVGLAAAQAPIVAKNLNNEQLVQAVLKDPKVYATLTPEKQSEVQPLLARLGFTNFLTKPSDTELTTLYNTQRNWDAVKKMQEDFATGKYDWITGKVLGHAKDIPWIGDDGQILDAQMGELRSTVGDLIKSGTLRSSDLPVYEKMFPKTTDTTDVIKGKLNNLVDRLGDDLSTYRSSLQSAGRALPGTAAPAAGPPAGSGETPAGSLPALKQSKPGDEPKMVWYGPDGKEYSKPPAVAPANGKAAAAVNPNPGGYVAGHVYGGMTYLGGDPNNRSSWK